jgi:hypothetical protein
MMVTSIEKQITHRAYELWEQAGKPEGRSGRSGKTRPTARKFLAARFGRVGRMTLWPKSTTECRFSPCCFGRADPRGNG